MPGLDLQQIGQNWLAYRSAVFAGLALVPVALLLGWWLHRRLGRPLRVTVAELGMVCGTLPWLYLTLRGDPDGPGQVFLVPFTDLAHLAAGGTVDLVTQVVGNLLVFAALGFFLPVRFASFASPLRVLAIGAAGSLAIEVTQLVAGHGRTFSVDDIALNATGAMLAALCSRPWWAERRTPQRAET